MFSHVFEEPWFSIYQSIAQISVGLTVLFSLLFLLIKVSDKPSLQGYRLTKRIMAFAYMLVAAAGAFELLETELFKDGRLMLLNTVAQSSMQLFLLSATLITLFNTRHFTKRAVYIELLPTIGLTVSALCMIFLDHPIAYQYTMEIFIGYIVYQYIRYSLIFWKERSKTLKEFDNYFAADSNANQLSWITKSFVGLMFTGAIAIFSFLFPGLLLIPFSILYLIYYFYLGVNHLNYVYYFHEYESIFTRQNETVGATPIPHSLPWENLEQAINQWEQTGAFTEPGLNIEQVAAQLNTNRTYLSNFVNQIKQQSFKEWITQLRIEEAKRLLLDKPSVQVGQIGAMVGLSDKSNFGRLFARYAGGVSPQTWRNEQKKRINKHI